METSTFTQFSTTLALGSLVLAIIALLAGGVWVWTKRIASTARKGVAVIEESSATVARRVVALTVAGRESAREFGRNVLLPPTRLASLSEPISTSAETTSHDVRRPGMGGGVSRGDTRVVVLR
jgi:hypothetical protein